MTLSLRLSQKLPTPVVLQNITITRNSHHPTGLDKTFLSRCVRPRRRCELGVSQRDDHLTNGFVDSIYLFVYLK